ncbi:hypothetical protein ACFOLJ_21220 [Rugamonas sp. CCM 8940]|uniref:hypothetical protein n=1 Tax=Rugamonas sp. CCM 8940 TaxID=2765359 RepID=UPI0018F7087A|nr:hypothetical protein [Rugamonas sp. CCM 8940]MBJ7312658.1 hypothetical protein [Rugamonas sp. CCM 8940]
MDQMAAALVPRLIGKTPVREKSPLPFQYNDFAYGNASFGLNQSPFGGLIQRFFNANPTPTPRRRRGRREAR